jgi:hypothetical protein
MVSHDFFSVCDMYGHLRSEMTTLLVLMETVPGTSTAALSPYVLKTISVFVADSAAEASARMSMRISSHIAIDLKVRIDQGEVYTAEAMYKELQRLFEAIMTELHQQKFVYIHPSITT